MCEEVEGRRRNLGMTKKASLRGRDVRVPFGVQRCAADVRRKSKFRISLTSSLSSSLTFSLSSLLKSLEMSQRKWRKMAIRVVSKTITTPNVPLPKTANRCAKIEPLEPIRPKELVLICEIVWQESAHSFGLRELGGVGVVIWELWEEGEAEVQRRGRE